VISQAPEAATEAPKGTKITLTVSRGTELAEVPKVTGKSSSAATEELQGAGFKVSTKEEFSDSTDKGVVMRQSPQAGVSIEVGSTVTIVVSKGQDLVSVPNVEGDTQDDAVQAISDAGLTAEVNETVNPDEVGLVVAQDPSGGADVKRGSTVKIWIGIEPPPP
jgi:serine/threonine-protein kinase